MREQKATVRPSHRLTATGSLRPGGVHARSSSSGGGAYALVVLCTIHPRSKQQPREPQIYLRQALSLASAVLCTCYHPVDHELERRGAVLEAGCIGLLVHHRRQWQ